MKMKSVKFYQNMITKQYLIKVKYENGKKRHTYFANYEKAKDFYQREKERLKK